MAHEDGHIRNIVTTVDGKGPGSVIDKAFSFYRGEDLFVLGKNHGTVAYYDAIRNAGRLHIGHKIVEASRPGTQVAWRQFGWKKWLYLLPKRF